METMKAAELILQERFHQDQQKDEGRFNHTCADADLPDLDKLAILGEEVGETARSILEKNGRVNDLHNANLQKEVVQVGAVLLAWFESKSEMETMKAMEFLLDFRRKYKNSPYRNGLSLMEWYAALSARFGKIGEGLEWMHRPADYIGNRVFDMLLLVVFWLETL